MTPESSLNVWRLLSSPRLCLSLCLSVSLCFSVSVSLYSLCLCLSVSLSLLSCSSQNQRSQEDNSNSPLKLKNIFVPELNGSDFVSASETKVFDVSPPQMFPRQRWRDCAVPDVTDHGGGATGRRTATFQLEASLRGERRAGPASTTGPQSSPKHRPLVASVRTATPSL